MEGLRRGSRDEIRMVEYLIVEVVGKSGAHYIVLFI